VVKESSKLESFAAAKVIIDTLSVNPIEDETIIQVDNKGFRVSVFETKTEYTIFHIGPLDEDSSIPSTIKENVKIGGIESDGDPDGQVNLDHDHRQLDPNNDAVLRAREADQARQDSCSLNLNSNHTHQVGLPQGCPSINSVAEVEVSKETCDKYLSARRMEGLLGEPSLNGNGVETEGMARQIEGRRMSISASSGSTSAKTKTKTAQLSENGYSVEMAKIIGPRRDQVEIEHIDNLVTEANQCENYPASLESDGSAPPGFDIERISAPPGFEGLTLPSVSPVRKVKTTKDLNGPAAVKRITRSQVKKGREQIRMSKANLDRSTSKSPTCPVKKGMEESPVGRQSVETTDNMVQLAEEPWR